MWSQQLVDSSSSKHRQMKTDGTACQQDTMLAPHNGPIVRLKRCRRGDQEARVRMACVCRSNDTPSERPSKWVSRSATATSEDRGLTQLTKGLVARHEQVDEAGDRRHQRERVHQEESEREHPLPHREAPLVRGGSADHHGSHCEGSLSGSRMRMRVHGWWQWLRVRTQALVSEG